MEKFLLIDNVQVPRFIYGTAWKNDNTRRLTGYALEEGFRGFDTANQRKHYVEKSVGEALARGIKNGLATREGIFLQTKYTFQKGQDKRLPYEPDAPISDQVTQSFASSLVHLQTDYIDSYLLHGPTHRVGLGPSDFAAWQAMETLHESGQAVMLGISNIRLDQLQELCNEAKVKPRIVQNRCFASRGWDCEIRAFCLREGIIYQGFSLLTANRREIMDPRIIAIARRHGRSVNQIVFRFALESGMVPLTGTTDRDHMRIDLEVFGFRLEPHEIEVIATLAR